MNSRKRYLLFLDESGTHNYRDQGSTVFGLGGCVFEWGYYQRVIEIEFSEFKKSFFGTSDVILHYADYVRNQKGFEALKGKIVRSKFYKELALLLRSWNFKIVACRVNKPWHWEKYGPLAFDPYHYALTCIIERFVFFLKEHSAVGDIVAESRTMESGTNSLDSILKIAYLQLEIEGTAFVRSADIKGTIPHGLRIHKKEENIAGLQIADSLITPIVRRKTIAIEKLERQEQAGNALEFKVIEEKFRTDYKGNYQGYGLIDLP